MSAPDNTPLRPNQRRRATPWGLLVSGFTIVLPLLTMGIVLGKFFETLQHVVLPFLDWLPGRVIESPSLRFLAVCIGVVLLLLWIGMIGRTRVGRALGERLESGFLNRVPLYAPLRHVVSGLGEPDDEKSLRPVLLTLDCGAEQLGLLIERHANGRRTLFLPYAPNPGSGTVLIVDASRVRELPVPGRSLLSCLGQWGHGTARLLAEAEYANGRHAVNPDGSAS